MLLDRIDIDNHGPLSRVELGPFSEHLNVVCAPEGSGKTAIARFVRDSLIRREYPLGMMSSSAGRVVWADRNGKIHCRREHDGTASGRRTIEFESRGDVSHRFDWLHGSWIEGIADSTDATRALEAIRIPESIVDGIVTDTAVTSVSRVIQSCLRSGLCDPALLAGLPINRSGVSGLSPEQSADADARRRSLRDELARVEAELATIERDHAVTGDNGYRTDSLYGYSHRHETIAARRQFLKSRLAELESMPPRPINWSAYGSVDAELGQLHDRIWQLRVRHSELSRWLAHLQSDRNRVRYTAPITSAPYARSAAADLATGLATTHRSMPEVDAELRHRLIDVDAQITRWRRVLAELSGLREIVASDADRYANGLMLDRAGAMPLSEHVLRRERMNHFLASLDRYSDLTLPVDSWDVFVASDLATRWPDEIDLRIEAIVRQIDALARHYDRYQDTSPTWYRDLPAQFAYRGSESLVRSLISIRDELRSVRRQGFRFSLSGLRSADRARADHVRAGLAIQAGREQELVDLRRGEQWVSATIGRLLAYREGLVRDRQLAELVRYPSWLDENYQRQQWSSWYINHLDGEAVARSRELDEVTAELDRCVRRAAQLRHPSGSPAGPNPSAMHDPAYPAQGDWSLGLSGSITHDGVRAEFDTIRAELRELELASPQLWVDSPRRVWLKKRRSELIEQLGVPHSVGHSGTPLADEASQWLVRLSGGRLRRVDWNPADFTMSAQQVAVAKQAGFAKIDGRDEAVCSALDRALASLAVRLAAADLLARTGRTVPLVVEAHRELLRGDLFGQPISDNGMAVIAALDDYAKNGRQVIVLASDPAFAEQIRRRGGQVFTIAGERIAHEHRPLWRPHFSAETYAGPFAGDHLAASAVDPMPHTDAYVDRYHDQYFDSLPIGASLADVNRNLDAIWQEAYGISPYSVGHPAVYPATGNSVYPATGNSVPPLNEVPMYIPPSSFDMGAIDPGNWHDGYYFADTYTTASPRQSASTPQPQSFPVDKGNSPRSAMGTTAAGSGRSVSPFFLTVDSPIDQAPSVDAVAASRLRGLQVTHINHLMNQDPNRLADSLGLAGVTAATIRRWQAECRLVCHVPQLRGFDARVLVGCGIADAGLLASTDPMDLLDRVEAFLATERGQRILLSGTSYELSRITSWIAAANVNTDDGADGPIRDHQTVDGRVLRQVRDKQAYDRELDNDRYEYEFVDDNGNVVRARSKRPRSRRRSTAIDRRRSESSARSGNASRRNGRARNIDRETANGQSRNSDGRRRRTADGYSDSAGRIRSRRGNGIASARARRSEYSSNESSTMARPKTDRESGAAVSSDQTDLELRFYLDRESPIVDAPSIGARMAEKLEAVGIMTVSDLLDADPADLADQLDHRRIDADVITAWQNQAILVCRIPMLRGHDAQLLVAADVTTAEEVAEYEPSELLALIDPIARSNEGKRIIRGGKLPDLQEISEWIHYAAQCRELVAA